MVLLVAPSDFNTGELSESERNAVDVLDKAMEYCRDSMVSGGKKGGREGWRNVGKRLVGRIGEFLGRGCGGRHFR